MIKLMNVCLTDGSIVNNLLYNGSIIDIKVAFSKGLLISVIYGDKETCFNTRHIISFDVVKVK